MKKPPPARSSRPIYRTPLGVAYIPGESPRLKVAFRDCILHLAHDGKNFRPSGVRHTGGADVVFPCGDDLPRWDFSEPQRAFVAAMMLGRLGLGPEEGFST